MDLFGWLEDIRGAIQGLINNIEGLWVAIQGIYNSIIGFFGDVAEVGKKLLDIPTSLTDYLSFFPTSLVTLLLIIVGILVLYKTAGRS